MNRGRRAERIFNDPNDYTMFIALLKEASESWRIRVSAYCLMPNHYHLLVQTPEANISRSMRHINGVYTQRFNRRHGFDGQLFRGRFKSIVIDADSYLLPLVRYIHRNPIRAKIATLDDYQWSSHKGYLSKAKKWDWIHKSFVFKYLSENKRDWKQYYRQLMAIEDDGYIARVIEGQKWPSVLGAKDFTDWIKGTFYELRDDTEVPQIRELAPAPEEIMAAVCDFYGIDPDELAKSKRGVFNEPRDVAFYLMRRMRGEGLKQIGTRFGIQNYSSVSSAIERLKVRMETDRKLKKRAGELLDQLQMSQGQT
jgi:REP element-mobilizing transposase RayT